MILSFRGKTPQIPDSCFIAPSVDIVGDVCLGEDTNVWFGAIIRGDMHYVSIGQRTNIQDGVTVHVTTNEAATEIGSDVTIGHNAIIHGCTIEDKCLIGMGATIMDKSVIGSGSIIGAGALVAPGTIIPPRSLCVGLPAKIIRSISDAEFKSILESSAHYVEFAREYMQMGTPGPSTIK